MAAANQIVLFTGYLAYAGAPLEIEPQAKLELPGRPSSADRMAEKRRRQGADVIPILYIIQGVLELYSEGQCRPTRLIETSIIGSAISTGTAGTRTALLGK